MKFKGTLIVVKDCNKALKFYQDMFGFELIRDNDGNMELFEGLYYIQNGIVYLCTRNTEQPVYHALSDLVGLYVEVYQP